MEREFLVKFVIEYSCHATGTGLLESAAVYHAYMFTILKDS